MDMINTFIVLLTCLVMYKANDMSWFETGKYAASLIILHMFRRCKQK